MECQEKTSGTPAYVVCAVNRDGQGFEFVPLAQLFDGNPFDILTPPTLRAEP